MHPKESIPKVGVILSAVQVTARICTLINSGP